jgi:hypothetical protein
MPKVTETGKEHSDAQFVTSSNTFLIVFGTTWLNNSRNSVLNKNIYTIPKREEAIGGTNGSPLKYG